MSAGNDKRRTPRTSEPVRTTSVRRVPAPSGSGSPASGPERTPGPATERRVYRAGDETDSVGGEGKTQRRRAPMKPVKRTPILAILALVLVAVAIALTGLAARDGGLAGSGSEPGAFRLLPVTTTSTT
jgi:hypothetical protein